MYKNLIEWNKKKHEHYLLNSSKCVMSNLEVFYLIVLYELCYPAYVPISVGLNFWTFDHFTPVNNRKTVTWSNLTINFQWYTSWPRGLYQTPNNSDIYNFMIEIRSLRIHTVKSTKSIECVSFWETLLLPFYAMHYWNWNICGMVNVIRIIVYISVLVLSLLGYRTFSHSPLCF